MNSDNLSNRVAGLTLRQQNAHYPGDVAGAVNQVAQQYKMNPKWYEAQRPGVSKRIQQQQHLGMQRAGPEERQVIRRMQQVVNGYQV